jgi:hypothetical protein
MYELNQVGENTFYINCPAKMGVCLLPGHRAILIDSGNDKEAGKKVLKIFAKKTGYLYRPMPTRCPT